MRVLFYATKNDYFLQQTILENAFSDFDFPDLDPSFPTFPEFQDNTLTINHSPSEKQPGPEFGVRVLRTPPYRIKLYLTFLVNVYLPVGVVVIPDVEMILSVRQIRFILNT